MERPLALVVVTAADIRAGAMSALTATGVESIEAATEAEGLEILRTRPVRVALVGATETLDPARFAERGVRLRPSLVVVAIAEDRHREGDAEVLGERVFDVESRPPEPAHLRLAVRRALAQYDLLEERRALREQVQNRLGYQNLIGRSDAMERVRERIERLATTEMRVLFVGETGTGRKLAARMLHATSPRRDAPFLQFDCVARDPKLLEAEVFGRERGSYPGGDRRAAGLLENASGGTVLLHEFSELPLEMQERLRRVVQSGTTVRVGGTEPIPVDVRFVATSSGDLRRRVEDGRVLRDLYHALAAAVVELPPLRSREGDIATLAAHFAEEIRSINDLPAIVITPEALDALARHDWPGNVRELRSAIEQAVILATDGTIRPRDLPEAVRLGGSDAGHASAKARFREAKRKVVESFEKGYLEGLLERHQGNVTAAAVHAGMLRSALQRLLRKYDLRSSDYRRGRREKSPDS
jgi:DNA-binding NtrC family response regulator